MENLDFNIELGSVGDKVAGYTAMALQASSVANLTDMAHTAEDMVTGGVESLMNNAPEKIANMITDEISKLLTESGAMDSILDSMNVAMNVVELLKKGLDFAIKGATAAANITDVCGTKTDAVCIPSVKECTKAQYATVKTTIVSKAKDIKLQLIDFYNSLICTNGDTTIDNVMISVNNILDFVEPYLDPLLQEKTGYTISEVRYTCSTGFQYIKMFQRLCQEKRAAKETEDQMSDEEKAAKKQAEKEAKEKEKAEKEALKQAEKEAKAKQKEEEKRIEEENEQALKDSANEAVDSWWKETNSEYISNGMIFNLEGADGKYTALIFGSEDDYTKDEWKQLKSAKSNIESQAKKVWKEAYNAEKSRLVEEAKEQLGALGDTAIGSANLIADGAKDAANDIANKGKDFSELLSKDFSEDAVKEKLLAWLNDQSIVLQNAFHLIMIKDMINDIKDICSKVGNCSIENFADVVNAVNDVFSIFEMLGLTPDAQGLTKDDLIALGAGAIGAATATAKAVQDLAFAITNLVVSESKSIALTANGAVNNLSSSATDAANSISSTAQNTADSAVDTAKSTANNAVDQSKNIGEHAANSAMTTASNVTTTGVNAATNIATDKLSNITNTNTEEEDQYSGESVVIDDTNIDGSTITVKITLYDEPESKEIKTFLNENYQSNKKDIFANSAKKIIIDNFKRIWNSTNPDNDNEFDVLGKIDKITRTYHFIVTVDKEAKTKYEQNKKSASNITDNSSSEIKSLANTTVNAAKNLATGAANSLVNNASSAGLDTLNNAKDSASNLASSAANGTVSATTGLSDSATRAASDVANSALTSASNLTNSLLNITVPVDLSFIEEILAGKVMMFDEVVQLLKVLNPVIEVLKILCHLLENYKINKEKVANKAHMDMADVAKNAYQFGMGLKDKIDSGLTNFYTVRTKKLYNWCKDNLGAEPNKEGVYKGTVSDTNKLNVYLSTHKADREENPVEKTLNTLLPTTFYFDSYAIDNGGFLDGTENNMPTLAFNPELGEIYYDANGRSPITSLIMIALMHNEDPDAIIKDDISEEALNPIEELMQNISVESDEFEGTQSIALNSLNLCEPAELLETQVDDSSKAMAIIEFGSEYTKGDNVDYVLNVKPGETINKDTILAYISKNGKTYPVKSLFESGTVKSNGNDYYHVYGNSCSRHIIIEDYVLGSGTDYDPADTSILTKKMQDSGELFSLIVNNMCYSALPVLLTNKRYNGEISNVASTYEKYIEKYVDKIKSWGDKITAANDKVKNSKKTTPALLQNIADEILSIRNAMYDDIVSYWQNNLYSISCTGDANYEDCAMLAYNKANMQNKIEFKIGDSVYYNYYFNLLTMVNMQMDMTIEDINQSVKDIENKTYAENNKFYLEYYALLKSIIDNRQSTEKYVIGLVINEFNKLYVIAIQGHGEYLVSNQISDDNSTPYAILLNKFKGDTKYSEIYDYIKADAVKRKLSDDEKNNLPGICKQLTNVFIYLKLDHANTSYVPTLFVIDKELAIDSFNVIYNANTDTKIEYPNHPYTIAKQMYSTYKNEYEDGDSILLPETRIKTWFENNGIDSASIRSKLLLLLQNIEKSEMSSEATNYLKNIEIYKLTLKEQSLLESFWEKMINTYKEYSMDAIINDFKEYANKLSSGAEWPSPISISIKEKSYKLFEFLSRFEEEKQSSDDIEIPPIDENIEEPTEITLDDETYDIKQPDEKTITILDYAYWAVYFTNATVFTLLPLYWADGFDIPNPSGLTPVLMPAIYIPIAPPVMIKPLNMLLVFGIGLRGIWPMPIILTLNMGSLDINALVPINLALLTTKDMFQLGMEYLENGIPTLINGMINRLTENNAELKKAYEKYKLYASIVKSIPVEDKAAIEKEILKAVYGDEIDNRQVITRLEKLDNGPDPL